MKNNGPAVVSAGPPSRLTTSRRMQQPEKLQLEHSALEQLELGGKIANLFPSSDGSYHVTSQNYILHPLHRRLEPQALL